MPATPKIVYHAPAESKLLPILQSDEGWADLCAKAPQTPHPIYPQLSREKLIKYITCGYGDTHVVNLLQRREEVIRLEKVDMLNWGFEFPMWKQADELWARGRELLILGGNRCLGGETLIYDPVLDISRRIDSIDGPHHVLAWDGSGPVVAEADQPFTKGLDEIFSIELSDGSSFSAASSHLVCNALGLWQPCGWLLPGDGVYHLGSNWDTCWQARPSNAGHCWKTGPGSQSGYRSEFCSGDEQPLPPEDTFPVSSLSRAGVPRHRPVCEPSRFAWPVWPESPGHTMDDPDNRPSHIRPWSESCRLSTLCDQDQTGVQFSGIQSQTACTPYEPLSRSLTGSVSERTNRQTLAGFGHPLQSTCEVLPLARAGQVSFVTSIRKERTDVKWDMTVPAYGNYFAAGCLHKNSSKSNFAAKRVIQMLIKKPGCSVWCFSTSHETSIRDQQRLIWQYLPAIWRVVKRNRVTNISYTQKSGFSMKALVCPNGSECRFMNYQQDADVIEGGQIDLWWADELIPADWIVTLRSRVIDRRGKGIVTQTPIKGYTQTVAEYVTGARVTEWAECEQLPTQILWPGAKPGMVPYKMQCMNPALHVMFFHSKHNPYVPYEDLVSAWKDKGTANVLCRLYGITSGVSHAKFPRFGAHNIISHEKIPQKGTNFHVVDFSWSKPWAMLWARVQRVADKTFIYIYREWPDLDGYGEWVVRSERPDGAPGPAQHPCGFGIGEYKRLILGLEGHNSGDPTRPPEAIFARYGDPRSGASTALADEGATTIFQMLEREDEKAPAMIVEPVAGHDGCYHILEGVNLINEWLAYDPDQPIGPLNTPQLFISAKCQNLIDCLKMWTGADKDKGASKDFIDLLRYLSMMGPDDHANNTYALAGGGSY